MKTVWKLTAPATSEKAFGKHPTQKPIELLERILLASTSSGDLVFDPFSGSSTTGVAAVNLDRRFLGCEMQSEYVALSIKRLKHAIKDANSKLVFGG